MFKVYMSSQETTVAHIASTLGSTLTYLSLSYCSRLTDVAILAVAAHCTHLTDLEISRLHVTDLSVSEIALQCPLLERLNISYCEDVTERSVMLLKEKCTALDELNIKGCYGILMDEVDDYDDLGEINQTPRDYWGGFPHQDPAWG